MEVEVRYCQVCCYFNILWKWIGVKLVIIILIKFSAQATASMAQRLRMRTSSWSILEQAGWVLTEATQMKHFQPLVTKTWFKTLVIKENPVCDSTRWAWPTLVQTPTGPSSSSWRPRHRGWMENTWCLAKSWMGWWVEPQEHFMSTNRTISLLKFYIWF